jgi:hypothetical protein
LLRGANSSIQIAVPTAMGRARTTVVPSTHADPKADERRPACSALRDG